MNSEYKILVVDDTPELLDITVRTIKKAGYIVFSAADGAECIKKLHLEKPDIILLDVMLPDNNGKDIATQIKRDPEFSSVFIILLSSLRTSPDYVSEGLEDGADGYIIRPVEKRELLARIAAGCRIIKAERELKAASVKYQSLFSAMQEGVYLHEMVYNEDGKPIDYRIIEANPISEELLNIKPEDAIGKLATELYATDQAPFLDVYSKVAETGDPVTFEQYFPPMDKYFQISAYSPGKGKFATAFSDISLRKVAEEKLKHKNAELQKINAEKDKFFSIIAHDLKSPFNSILGFSEHLVEQVAKKDYENIENFAEIILKSSQTALNLLSNLMEWAQSQTGRMKFSPEQLDLTKLINDIVTQFENTALQKEIVVSKSLPHGLLVFADNSMLSTVLRNLISNAIKFTYPGGKIRISAEKNQNEIKISVGDTGKGISNEVLNKLFQIDGNITSPGTQNETGTGLGLILCKEFVKKNGGKIWVESKVNEGSTFYFTIPEHSNLEKKIIPLETVKDHARKAANLKILITEDDSTSELLLSTMLSSVSTEIITAKTGKEAIEMCHIHPDIDLIIMDIKMPEMDGYETTLQIREFNKEVIIIAQTAYGLDGEREKAHKSGCNDYISKPIKKTTLLDLIIKYFGV